MLYLEFHSMKSIRTKFNAPQNLSLINPKRSTKQMFLLLVITVYLLSFTGLLDPIRTGLEIFSFSVGSIQDLTLYNIIKRGVTLILLFWATTYFTEKGFQLIEKLPGLKASNRAII